MVLRSAVVVLAAAAVLTGCSSDPQQAILDEGAELRQQTEAYCDALRANATADDPINALNASGPAPHPAEEIAAAVEPLRASNQSVLDAAPAEIRPDAELAFQMAKLQLDIYERAGGDPAAVTADPEYVAKIEQADPALKKLQRFNRTICGVDAG